MPCGYPIARPTNAHEAIDDPTAVPVPRWGTCGSDEVVARTIPATDEAPIDLCSPHAELASRMGLAWETLT